METSSQEQQASKPAETKHFVGIQFHSAGEIVVCSAKEFEFKQGEQVLIQSQQGKKLGTVIKASYDKAPQQEEIPQILHVATKEDIAHDRALKEKALEYLAVCEQKVKERKLPMKLTLAEIVENGRKAMFTFFAEDRVDFRALVKDLATSLRLRIEMKQIGARDEAKYKGCLGACGQVSTCCSTFLRSFKSISIGMAKNQGLSPNPAKLTGMCGRLKCCLAYENEQYKENRKGLFKISSVVSTPKGSGTIFNIDILKRTYSVRLDEGGEDIFSANDCSKLEGAKQIARERVMSQRQSEEKKKGELQRERQEKFEKRIEEKKRKISSKPSAPRNNQKQGPKRNNRQKPHAKTPAPPKENKS